MKTLVIEEIEITSRYVDESELIGLFGERSNPFLSTYYKAQFQRIVVFELIIKNGSASEYKFDSNQCMLSFGGKNVEADNPFELENYWELLESDQRNLTKKLSVIERFMLPGRETIPVGGELSGYLVFRSSGLPREGEGEVDLYGGKIGRFEFPYNFVLAE